MGHDATWICSRCADMAATFSGSMCSQHCKPPRRPYLVSNTGIMEPSPSPQMVFSALVAFSLRCLPSKSPFGPNHSCVRNNDPRSRSVTETQK